MRAGLGSGSFHFLPALFSGGLFQRPVKPQHHCWVSCGLPGRFSEPLGGGHLGWQRTWKKTRNGFHVTPRVVLSVACWPLIG